jgi:ACS family glucarate transporter-like MFS transporter
VTRGGFRIRWLALALLFAFSFMAYVQRTGVSIAAERIMPELGFSQDEIGWLLTAFLISYTAFQFPGAVLGEGLGPRRILPLIAILAVLASFATGLMPMVSTGLILLLSMMAARFVLGLAQGPLFPICGGVIEQWFPPERWAGPQGLLTCGLGLGAAATPPAVVAIMATWGWQVALIATSVPALAVAVLWWVFMRDDPTAHPLLGPVERAELGHVRLPPRITLARMWELLFDRNVLLLSLSYLLMNYVYYLLTFWCFLYLVQERHFTELEGGWLASLPFIAAALGSAVGGGLSDVLVARFGAVTGYRLVPLVTLPLGGLALVGAVEADGPYWAVAWMSVAFALIEMTEGAYWAATTEVGEEDTMMATAILNTGGNIGGVIGTPLVAYLSGGGHWTAAFLTGTGLAFASALLWLGVDAGREPQG